MEKQLRRYLQVLSLMLSCVVGCQDHSYAVAPASRVSLILSAASLSVAQAIDVHAFYLLASAPITLVRETIGVAAGSQSIPLVLDISQCIRDGEQRTGICAVLVDVRLLDESGAPIDSARIGPLSVTSGATVERDVTLRTVASVSVQLATALDVGDTVVARADLQDGAGATLSGRVVNWSTSNPSVATVNAAGRVIALAPGTADIVARAEGVTGQVQLNVYRRSFGQVVDQIRDAGSAGSAPPPDLLSASIAASRGDLSISVRFTSGTFDPAVTRATVFLDTDGDPATGHPGVASSGAIDAGVIGAEYVVTLGSASLAGQAQVLRYTGPPINTFALAGSFPVSFVANGMDVTVPLARLGNDDGLMAFKVVGTVQLTATGFSSILDVMPDVGAPAGSSQTVGSLGAFYPAPERTGSPRDTAGQAQPRAP